MDTSGVPRARVQHQEPQRLKQKKGRKWHHRGFNGCATCKQRHVKCDEVRPCCSNCERLSLDCGGYEQKLVFKLYDGSLSPSSTYKKADSRQDQSTTLYSENDQCNQTPLIKNAESPGFANNDALVISYDFNQISSPILSPQLFCPDTEYYSHFLGTVSTILLVWDAPYNSNPYRFSLPQLAQSSWSLTESMKALGALHLANTSAGEDRKRHLKSAMKAYGGVIRDLRKLATSQSSGLRLPDLATSLLLCLFEMMDSQSDGWRVHLLGASNIYKALFNTEPATGPDDFSSNGRDLENTHPVRRFLVSLLAYLDVAGACATGSGTLITGDYWETHGGGWEYNLGVPSFSHNLNDNGTLGQIRQSWSRLMSIQADISAFAKKKREGMSKGRQEMTRNDLESRLTRWRLNAPNCFARFRGMQCYDDEELEWYLMEAIGFVEAYEKATIIYLHKVCTSGQPRSQSSANDIQDAVLRILYLADKFCTGIVQLGMPWALFIAGAEVTSPDEQAFVRQKFVDMARFGMMNSRKALNALESTWLQKQIFGKEGFYATNIQTSILLP